MEHAMICALMPHPPIMIPEIGKGELDKMTATVVATEQAAKIMKEENPQTIVLITPHGPAFQDAASISIHPRLKGNFGAFGVPDVFLGFETDDLLTRHILRQAERLGVNLIELTDDVAKSYRINLELDHGALVPLYYMHQAGFKGQLIHISVGMLSYEEMYTFGKAVQKAVGMAGKRVAVIASGDLSHRLSPNAPAGYSPQAAEFDKQVVEAVKELNIKALLNMDRNLIAAAGECGLRPIFFLMGVIGGTDATAELLSYEAPFGVGYAVALIRVKGKEKGGGKGKMVKESIPVALARASLQYFLDKGLILPVPDSLDSVLGDRAGVFVSLKKQGQLRGCIGTFQATKPSIASEIIHNAIQAGTADPRFPPVELGELSQLTMSVDVLGNPEPVESVETLDPQKYGVIVRKDNRSGLLLPMLEGVETVEEQLSIAMQKAGIGMKEEIELYRFTVTRYK